MREEDKIDIEKERWGEPLKSKINSFRSRINRFYDEGYYKWKPRDIKGHYLTLNEVIPYLKKWEEKGYVKIFNTENCVFEVLTIIKEPVEELIEK